MIFLMRLCPPVSNSRPLVRVAAACILATLLGGCRWPWSDNGASSTMLLSGTVEARETDLAFQVPGRIAALAADEGDAVEAGQKVAALDATDYEVAQARAEAEAEAGKAALAALEAGSRPQEIKVAEAVVIQAEAQLKFARAESQRLRKLVTKNLVSQDQLDRASLEEDVAQAGLAKATQQLALLREGPRQEEIARIRAEYRARQEAVAAARQQLAYTDLASPVAGRITVRLAEPGEVVAGGQAVLRVASLDRPWVRAYVNETDLSRIRLGQAAEVKADGLPSKTFSGRITFISPEAEFTPKTVETRDLRVDLVYRVKVEVANPQGTLKIGMPVDVIIPPAVP